MIECDMACDARVDLEFLGISQAKPGPPTEAKVVDTSTGFTS